MMNMSGGIQISGDVTSQDFVNSGYFSQQATPAAQDYGLGQ
jgi:hypothetical protein